MDDFQAIFELRKMLRKMEQDVGLDSLSPTERDVFLVASSLTKQPGDVVGSDAIRRHEALSDVPQATYHRSLRSLLRRGFLQHACGYKAKHYIVSAGRAGK